MDFAKFFKLISYLVVFCGFLSLFVSGGVEVFSTGIFIFIITVSWFLENSRWQISERLGTIFIFTVVPLFYVSWHYKLIASSDSRVMVVSMLAKMILILTGIKLLQRKADRDWLFLYLMAFFEVLLAAGLSISPLYLGSLTLYLLVTICAIVAFEIRKTSHKIKATHNLDKKTKKQSNLIKVSVSKLLLTAVSLLLLIIVFGLPLFFTLPRVGGAGFGGSAEHLSNITGFSDTVNLGEIGQLLQSDQIVMRSRLDKPDRKNLQTLKWRGVALDTFDSRRWSKSKAAYFEPYTKGERDFFLIDYASDKNDLIVQTVYLEPLDSPTLFAVSRPVAVEGNFQALKKDSEGTLTFQRSGFDRLSYKVYSDTNVPSVEELQSDTQEYSQEDQRYLQLPPEMDERINSLAAQISAKSYNRYDKAKAIEKYLQTQFAYSLEMKAQGEQPLADFLFNVRAGHCEYFASAMAIMLRTQGVATRIVNGFQQGEYNETADVFVIKQRDAHSWVEVYFPQENVWVPFDPTPFAEQNRETMATSGALKKFNSYIEALETFWIQYFVSYDNQEQRSLMRSFRSSLSEYQSSTSAWLSKFQTTVSDWWKEVRGERGFQTSVKALGFGLLYLIAAIFGIVLIIWLFRKISKLTIWRKIHDWLKQTKQTTIVEFYERTQMILANKGFVRAANQTPLEFASTLGMPEVVKITEKYNRVRFGEKNLSSEETIEIETWLKNLETKDI